MTEHNWRLSGALRRVERPVRYAGGEWNSRRKDWNAAQVHLALAYPDAYEIGMSNLGLQILYSIVNDLPWALADRTYAPWGDMEREMVAAGIPLFGVESRRSAADFDVLGFSLPYELNYTNVLLMLDLAGLPLHGRERDGRHPLVIAGGSAAHNPAPMSGFFDAMVIGEAEEAIVEVLDAVRGSGWRVGGSTGEREALLRGLGRIEGVYVPTIDGAGARTVRRRIVEPLPPIVTRPVVPFAEAVHDRAAIEIQRGCTRGCRFCQAGFIYRPLRERPQEEIRHGAAALLASTGYDELGLLSLSSSDYPGIDGLIRDLSCSHPTVRLSLPSLRIDSFSVGIAEAIQRRKGNLTFAPEAGTQRLRDAINKGVSEDDLLNTANDLFSSGFSGMKLYFMVGLPGEREEDVEGIVRLAREVKAVARRAGGGRARVTAAVSTFVPKAHTPFQWAAMETRDSVLGKQRTLKDGLRGINMSWHDVRESWLEAVFSRGDALLGPVVERAYRDGARFDAWSDQLREESWLAAFEAEGVEPGAYAHREREPQERLPWDHIDVGVTKEYLWREYVRSRDGEITGDCRSGACAGCGLMETGSCVARVSAGAGVGL